METTAVKTEDLIKMLANATVTYYECGGHHKAEMNEWRMKEYEEELKNRSAVIPSKEELLSTGIFNGKGAY